MTTYRPSRTRTIRGGVVMLLLGGFTLFAPHAGLMLRVCGAVVLAGFIGWTVKAVRLRVVVDGPVIVVRDFIVWHGFGPGVRVTTQHVAKLVGRPSIRLMVRSAERTKAIPLGMFDLDVARAMALDLHRAVDQGDEVLRPEQP